MSKDNSKREGAARSYDQGVSNRAQKPKKPRVAQGEKPAEHAGSSKPAPPKDAAKPKDASSDRKTVFKSTLDTPFRVDWPTISSALVTSFLDAFVHLLDVAEVAKHQAARGRRTGRGGPSKTEGASEERQSRKGKRKRETTDAAADGVSNDNNATHRGSKKRRVDSGDVTVEPIPPPPAILSHILLGINHVTKRLEGQLEGLSAQKRTVIGATALAQEQPPPPLKYVLVCTGDIDPPALVAHIPHLAAGCNSNSRTDVVLLVPLPKGAETRLAQAFGLPRASVVGITREAPPNLLDPLDAVSTTFPVVRAPWLVVPTPSSQTAAAQGDAMEVVDSRSKDIVELIPTHVKQLRTSAPRNIGAAKRARKEARAAVRAKLVSHPQSTGGGKPMKKARVVVTSVSESTG